MELKFLRGSVDNFNSLSKNNNYFYIAENGNHVELYLGNNLIAKSSTPNDLLIEINRAISVENNLQEQIDAINANEGGNGGACFYECTSLREIICRNKNVPETGDQSVFYSVGSRGTLTHPMNADYSTWMIFLSIYNWNEAETNFDNNNIFEDSDIIVESVQQFTTHIANAIRKVKGTTATINPQNFYNEIINL